MAFNGGTDALNSVFLIGGITEMVFYRKYKTIFEDS